MVYYEKIFEDLGVSWAEPGEAIMTKIVHSIYDEMDSMRAAVGKSFETAWSSIETCPNTTIRYIRLMNYYRFANVMINRAEFKPFMANLLRTCNQLRGKNRNTNFWDSTLDNVAINLMTKQYEILFANDRPASESVVTDCSPIAPYVGTTRTPFAGVIKAMNDPEGDEIDQEETLEKAAEGDNGASSIFGDAKVKRKALWHFVVIFNDAERFESILNFRQEIEDMYLNYGKYFVREMHHIYPIGVTEFIMYSNLAARPDTFPKAMKFMMIDGDYQHMSGNTSYEKDKTYVAKYGAYASMKNAMEAYGDMLDDENVHITEEELTADTNRVLAQAKHLLEQSVVEEKELKHDQDILHDRTIVPGDKLHTFNLNHLMNFIYTQRRYISDHYTIMAFLDHINVKTISYVQGFILIEPDLGAKPSEYIYVPVVDTLNGRKVCVIRYHRESNAIDVLSVQQYEESVRKVTSTEPPDMRPDPDESANDGDFTEPASGT